MRKAGLFILGMLLLVGGMTLVIRDWWAVVVLFKGVIGAVLAVGGLVVMFMASVKK